jgi:toxin ParE1/3/4
MKVVWTRFAIADLNAILDYIAERNPQAASHVQGAIIRSGYKLGAFPQMGRAAQRPGTRLWPVTGLPYVLSYRVVNDSVEIASVLDGRMDRDSDLL